MDNFEYIYTWAGDEGGTISITRKKFKGSEFISCVTVYNVKRTEHFNGNRISQIQLKRMFELEII